MKQSEVQIVTHIISEEKRARTMAMLEKRHVGVICEMTVEYSSPTGDCGPVHTHYRAQHNGGAGSTPTVHVYWVSRG